MRKALYDWVIVGCILVFVIAFLMLVHARGGTITGNLLAPISPLESCVSYSNLEVVSLSGRLNLCGGRTHAIEYLVIDSPDSTLFCNGSILQGNGGALFVSHVPNPRVTLRDCILRGYDGLYSNANPVRVLIR